MSKRIVLELTIGQTHGTENIYFSSQQVQRLLNESALPFALFEGVGSEGAHLLPEEISRIEIIWNETTPTHGNLELFCARLSNFLSKVANKPMSQRWALLTGFAFSNNSLYSIYIELELTKSHSILINPKDFFRRQLIFTETKALPHPNKCRQLVNDFQEELSSWYERARLFLGYGRRSVSHDVDLPKADRVCTGVNQLFELYDHRGGWCARCIRYFNSGDDIVAYHPYGGISNTLLRELELENVLNWTLYVHRDCNLPEGVSPDVMDAIRLNLLLKCQSWELENLANLTFYRGHLNKNIELRFILSQLCINVGNEAGAVIELAKATISNAGSNKSEMIGPVLDFHMPAVLNGMPHQEIQVLLGKGNRMRNIGQPDLAKQHYERALWLINNKIWIQSHKARSENATMRRLATVTKNVSSRDMRIIINNTKDQQYGYRTALGISGYNHFRNTEYYRAEKSFRAMFEQEPDAIASWWHKMAGWLGLGLAMYANNQKLYDKALICCLKAEYTSAMLGLRVDVTRGISEQLFSHGSLLSPSVVVRKIGQEKEVLKEEMEDIRRIALIDSGLQEELHAELNGRSWV
jgi:tetratricopeptide (TPR) repeat protein